MAMTEASYGRIFVKEVWNNAELSEEYQGCFWLGLLEEQHPLPPLSYWRTVQDHDRTESTAIYTEKWYSDDNVWKEGMSYIMDSSYAKEMIRQRFAHLDR